jgi:hypothetical protein
VLRRYGSPVALTALGLWLTAAPYVLGYGGGARNADIVVGLLVASFSFMAVWEIARALRRIGVPAGLWLVASALLLERPGAATANAAACGALCIAAALAPSPMVGRYGGGWRALWGREG